MMYRRMNPKELEKVIEEVKQHEMDMKKLSKLMEEMANAPKEEMNKRTPGERGMYEIQRSQDRAAVDSGLNGLGSSLVRLN